MKVEVHWAGGEVAAFEIARGKTGINRYVADVELVALVRELSAELSDAQIARVLNRKGLRTPKGLSFTAHRVSNLRHVHGIENQTGGRRLQGADVYTAEQAGRLLSVDRSTIIRWVEAGLLRGSQITAGAPWRVRVTEEDRRRLTAANSPDGWLPLKGAAKVLGVTQPTVLKKIKAGELKAVRAQIGRRSAWRILIVQATEEEQQPSLFDRATSASK